MFIVDIEEKKKNINKIKKELLLKKTIVSIEFQEQKIIVMIASYSIYSLITT